MLDFAVVGSGIGGSGAALMLNGYDTVLFEKDQNLGGCASTFYKKGSYFNTASTTFACYKKGRVVYDFLHQKGVQFQSRKLNSALCVIQRGRRIERYSDLDSFIAQINNVHYHSNNADFYRLIYHINELFYARHGYYYANASIPEKLASLVSFWPLAKRFYPYIFTSAYSFIRRFLPGIGDDYMDFIDNQLLIAAQAKSKEVNFLTAALALGYQFQDNHYVFGGLGSVFDAMAEKIPQVKTKTQIEHIEKTDFGYRLHTQDQSYSAKNIVLNSTVFDSAALFSNSEIRSYLKSYDHLDSGVSAFVMYLVLKKSGDYKSHYQIIDQTTLPYSNSNSVFVSFGDKKDEKMAKSVTISLHVRTSQWRDDYEAKQKQLQARILQLLAKELGLTEDMIASSFCAKPRTFSRFINRTTLGGIPIKRQLPVFRLPGNDTPFKGLYMVGDTTYAAQGWPGVLLGVNNLERLLCTK